MPKFKLEIRGKRGGGSFYLHPFKYRAVNEVFNDRKVTDPSLHSLFSLIYASISVNHYFYRAYANTDIRASQGHNHRQVFYYFLLIFSYGQYPNWEHLQNGVVAEERHPGRRGGRRKRQTGLDVSHYHYSLLWIRCTAPHILIWNHLASTYSRVKATFGRNNWWPD